MRTYFYEIDNQGCLYHDQSRLSDRKFLNFFFGRLKKNDSGQYSNYPYLSPCGSEQNYIQCTGTPFIFTNLQDTRLYLNHCDLWVLLKPHALQLSVNNHCLYHPALAHLSGRLHTNVQAELSDWIQEKDGQYSLHMTDGIYPIENFSL